MALLINEQENEAVTPEPLAVIPDYGLFSAVRNSVAHQNPFDSGDALNAFWLIEKFLRIIDAKQGQTVARMTSKLA